MQKLETIPVEINTLEAKELLDSSESICLLDVREADEVAICKIDGSTHIPMGQVLENLAQLPTDKKILVYCHHGGRSLHITELLRNKGLIAINIKGGIDDWAISVDSQVARY